jgi:hypothetical protein
MKGRKERLYVSLVMVVFLIIVGNSPTFGRAMLNLTGGAFEDPPPTSGGSSLSAKTTESTSISAYIIQGAGYFLKGYSDTLLVVNRVEMSDLNGTDFVELKSLVDIAVTDMQLARDTYVALVNKANNTDYKQEVIDVLLNFDYNSFKLERGLNGTIFNDVRDYLESGDVRGIYSEILNRIDSILADLISMKTVIDGNTLPGNDTIWRLNQKCSEAYLFGQYAAEVFYNL